MADYKRETRQVYFKNRAVHDPSKQLFEESRAKAQSDKSLIADMEKTGRDYSKALDSWNKNLTELGKEEAEFFKTVTPALTKFLGEDLIKIQKMRVEATDDKIVYDFSQKSQEEQNSIRRGHELTFAQIGENRGKRMDLEAQAREIFEKTKSKDALAFAEYLQAHNKRQDTSIFKMLMNENLQSYDYTLTEAFQQSDKIYTDRSTGEKFAGNEADTAERVQTVIDEERQKFYRATQVGGINTGIIAAFSEGTLNQKSELVRSSELKKINIRQAKANFASELDNVETALGITNLTTNDEGDWAFRRFDGEISPEVKQTLTGALKVLEQQAYNAGIDNPQQYAYEQLGERLRTIANGDEAKIEFFDQVLGVYGKDHPNAILLTHSADGKDVTFGGLNNKARSIFGSNGTPGSWAGNTRLSSENTTGSGEASTIGTKAFEKGWYATKWKPEGLVAEESLWDSSHPDHAKWQGTYKWEIAKMVENGDSSDVINARLQEMAEEALESGAAPELHNEILGFTPPKNEKQLQTFLIKNAEELARGNEIHTKDLEGFFVNKRAMNEWLEKQEGSLKDMVIVDEYSQNEDQITKAEDTTYRIIQSLSPSNEWTPGKEAILDEIIETAMTVSNRDDSISFQQALTDTLGIYRNIQVEKQTEHEWYQNKDGGFYRFKGHKDQWKSSDRRSEFQSDIAQANARRHDMVKRGLTPFNDEDLTNIAEEFSSTGTLPLEFLTVAANATQGTEVSVVDYLNNLIENSNDPKLKAKFGGKSFEASEDLKEILRIFPSNKLNTLYKLTKGGDFEYSSSNDFNVSASRIINQEINKDLSRRVKPWSWLNPLGVSWEDNRPVLPNQNGLLKTFEAGFNNGAGNKNAIITHEDGRVQLGKYGINKRDAERIWSLRYPNETYSDDKFLKNENNEQLEIAKYFISELTNKQLEKNIALNQGYDADSWDAIDGQNLSLSGSQMTRNMIHQFMYGTEVSYPISGSSDYENRLNEIGSDTLIENNNYLLLYDSFNNGGTMYDYHWRTREASPVN